MSFEEKSIWIQLVSLIIVLTGYGLVAGNMLGEGILDISAYLIPFSVAIGLVIVLVIAGSMVAAMQARPEGRDERDRLIGWRAKTWSTHVLEVGALVAVILLTAEVPAVWAAQVLILSLFLEEIARQVFSLAFYRRGF